MAVVPAEQHVSTAVEEEAEAAHAADDSDDEGAEAGEESSSEASDSQDPSTKKRKKKKKKKKGGAGASGGSYTAAAHPAVDPAARKEGDRRLQEAVDLLAHNSEDGMWVKLGGCHLADGKMKKLCEALLANTICISLDLSSNHLTDEGAKALAAALADGRAPDLIEVDLRDNPQIQQDGTSALEELQQHRKTLRVALGPSTSPPEQQQAVVPGGKPWSPEAGGQQHGEQQQQQQQQQAGEQHAISNGSSLAYAVKSNPVISKYFSVGNDDAEETEEQQQGQAGGQMRLRGSPDGEKGEEHLGGLSTAELAWILWDQLEQCLDAPRPDIPSVSEPLRAIAEQVEHEMDNCALPMLPSTEMGELKTFTQWALRKLHVLHSVLDLVPPPILTPYSKTMPVPSVGTHRAAVAELLAQLLRGECAAIAQRVAASGLLRRCAAIAVRHPNCSPIHGAVGRCLKLSLSKPVGHVGLWQQLLGSAPVAATAGAASSDRGGSLNLAVEAAAIAAAAAQAPSVGKRASNVGFALAIGQMLHSAATGEVLGANSQAPADEQVGEGELEGGPAAERAAAGSPSPSGTAEQQQQQQQQGGEAEEEAAEAAAVQRQGAADAPAQALDDPLADGNPLAPSAEQQGLHRTPSQPTLAKVANTAVADLPEEDEEWEQTLQAQLAMADAWTEFSAGPDCLLRKLLSEHTGDLGGPRPCHSAAAEQEEDDVSQGQVISGQELLLMLRGMNLGGFHGGI